jgi:acetylornithine deacetylase/succinyl-diaminopimelate desuccinylase-like protein
MRPYLVLAAALVACDSPSVTSDAAPRPDVQCGVDLGIDPQRIHADIAYFASDELRGRLAGSAGNELALDYIESLFTELGLEPMGDDGGYRQAFSVSVTTPAGQLVDVTTYNLLGAVPGTAPGLADEVILVGAHLDGVGDDPHLCPGASTTAFCPGADDNASGSAVVLELARLLTSADAAPARTVLFVIWGGEEEGFVGSCQYAMSDPAYPLARTRAVFSVDMVGVGDGGGLAVFGGILPENEWLVSLMKRVDADWCFADVVDAQGPIHESDQTVFSQMGMSAILVSSTGEHPAYHSPADNIDAITLPSLEASTRVLWLTLAALARGEEDD